MKIYTAIWKDRHAGITAHPFSTQEKAIQFARVMAKKYARRAEDYQEAEMGFIFYVSYSCKGDCIYVTETVLDGE